MPPQCGSSRCRSTQRERILIGHRASRRSETLSGHRHSSRKVLRDPALRSTIAGDISSSTMSFRGRGHTQQRGHGHTLGRFRGNYGRGRGSYGGGRAGGFTAPPHASGLNLLPSNGPNGHGGKGGKGFIASHQVSAREVNVLIRHGCQQYDGCDFKRRDPYFCRSDIPLQIMLKAVGSNPDVVHWKFVSEARLVRRELH